jgi:hypothetical protein
MEVKSMQRKKKLSRKDQWRRKMKKQVRNEKENVLVSETLVKKDI